MSSRKKRGESWSEDDLKAALRAVKKGQLSQRDIAIKYKIPRRTLRDHIKSGRDVKRMGRKPVLTEVQENDLCSRIKRFAKIGVPLTPKFIRKQAYMFCERFDIKHNFNCTKKIAGADWLRQFLKRNPSISKRKPQIMNPARAQKLNKPIVQEHFQSVRKLYDHLDIIQHPERLYNMDEKGCRITVHNQHTVLAEKGSKRVHLVAPEHAENVTIAMCVNAIGTAIPPMLLFKGQRQRPDLLENLPAGTFVRMAPKGSMTADLFVEFIQHLAKYKVAEKCLLIFDGAKCHLSVEALEQADINGIVLYCLPSNTTHELQPLDKSVNKSYEHHWDDEVLNFLYASADRALTKAIFNKIFTRVWSKCMTYSNIVNGFKATGLFPFNPDAIPDEAFAPSVLSEIPCPQTQEPLQSPIPNSLDIDANDTDEDHDHELAGITKLSTFQRKIDLSNQNINTEIKSRLVDYSSSSDISDIESILQNPKSQVTIEEDRESPSLIPINNLTCAHVFEIAPPHHNDGDKNLGQYDPAVPSCSGLQKPIRDDPNSDSTVSDLDSFVTRPIFKPSKYVAENIYDYTSDESSRDASQCLIDKGEKTPKKQIIPSIQNKTCCSDDDNVPLASLQQKNKTQFEQFLPTPNYASTKSKKPRKKAMNYKGQRITKDLFNDKTEKGKTKKKHDNTIKKMNKEQKRLEIYKKQQTNEKEAEKSHKKKEKENKAEDVKRKSKRIKNNKRKVNSDDKDNWYCYACYKIEELDMRQCIVCKRWYHEECVGLSKCDLEFICPDC